MKIVSWLDQVFFALENSTKMEIFDLKSKLVSSTGLSVVSLVVVTTFFVGVAASVKLCRHHHSLLLLIALGLNGAAWVQGLPDTGSHPSSTTFVF